MPIASSTVFDNPDRIGGLKNMPGNGRQGEVDVTGADDGNVMTSRYGKRSARLT